MEPIISVITPSCRGVDHLEFLTNDLKNQTFKAFEHNIIYDGEPSREVLRFIESRKKDYSLNFYSIPKDMGNMSISPGTKPRNYGISISKGHFLVFADDDDRYKSTYLERLVMGMGEGVINIVQMSCQESRMYKDGDPTKTKLVPEIGLPYFPMVCHVGTPCFIVPRKWAEDNPWQEEPEHDFRFIKRICDKYNPRIRIMGGMEVDVDGLVLRGLKDWVTFPPFYR